MNHIETRDPQLTDRLPSAFRSSQFLKELPDRVLRHLRELEHEVAQSGKFGAVNRLVHCLQTATLAFRAGEDEEYVALALVHDIGDLLAPYNHGEFAATLMAPFLSEANHWMVAHHHCFQGYYYFQHLGLDRNMREAFRGHPHFERTLKFCEVYDEPAFDPGLDTMPLAAFEPILRRVMLNPKRTILIPGSAEPGTVF
ncbi:MAG: HD domain-containing protein [Rhodospirillaceae bacterium]|nr:HD domain-containing protein [Rhodospirillaceae bacterium]